MGIRQSGAGLIRRGGVAALVAVVSLLLVAAAQAATPLAQLGQASQQLLVAARADPASAPTLIPAAAALGKATEPSGWTDSRHLVSVFYGASVFGAASSALSELQPLPSAGAVAAARSLALASVRGLARAAIAEAAGGDRHSLAAAAVALARGDRERSSGGGVSAVAAYERAWADGYAALTSLATHAASSIPSATLAAAAKRAATDHRFPIFSPKLLKSQPPLRSAGRPQLLLLSWEFCPYCATQSWGLVAALSQFGHFKGLQLVNSDPTDKPAVAGFTFRQASYSSSLLSLQTVEQLSSVRIPGATTGLPYEPLQAPTPAQAQLITTYDPGLSAPFLDLGNAFSTVGSTVDPSTLTGLDWSQIAAALRRPASRPAQAVAATTETITAEICEVTSGRPASVCGKSIVRRYESLLDSGTGGGFCPGQPNPRTGRSAGAADAARDGRTLRGVARWPPVGERGAR